MFKLILLLGLMGLAAAAPGALIGAPLVTSYGTPVVSGVSAPLTYGAYSTPLGYTAYAASYGAPYAALPYAYKAGYYHL